MCGEKVLYFVFLCLSEKLCFSVSCAAQLSKTSGFPCTQYSRELRRHGRNVIGIYCSLPAPILINEAGAEGEQGAGELHQLVSSCGCTIGSSWCWWQWGCWAWVEDTARQLGTLRNGQSLKSQCKSQKLRTWTLAPPSKYLKQLEALDNTTMEERDVWISSLITLCFGTEKTAKNLFKFILIC